MNVLSEKIAKHGTKITNIKVYFYFTEDRQRLYLLHKLLSSVKNKRMKWPKETSFQKCQQENILFVRSEKSADILQFPYNEFCFWYEKEKQEELFSFVRHRFLT